MIAAIMLTVIVCNIAKPPAAAIVPKTATPIAPAACLTVFNAADAVPDNVLSTLDRIPFVIAGTARPIPKEINRNGTDNYQNEVCIPETNKPANPSAKMLRPTNIGVRIP